MPENKSRNDTDTYPSNSELIAHDVLNLRLTAVLPSPVLQWHTSSDSNIITMINTDTK